jgi:hypothetical protein
LRGVAHYRSFFRSKGGSRETSAVEEVRLRRVGLRIANIYRASHLGATGEDPIPGDSGRGREKSLILTSYFKASERTAVERKAACVVEGNTNLCAPRYRLCLYIYHL